MKYLALKIAYPTLLVIAVPVIMLFMLLNAACSLLLSKLSFLRAQQAPYFYQQTSWEID